MSNFKAYKTALQTHVASLLAGNTVLYHTNVGGDELVQWFLDSLPAELRAEYTCNACRSFIKHYGGLVTIGADNEARNIWNFESQDEFVAVNKVLEDIVAAARVRDVFVPSKLSTSSVAGGRIGLGLDFNVAHVHDENNKPTGQTQRWEHLHVALPSTYFFRRTDSPEAEQGKYRDNKTVLQASLIKISQDSLDTIKELIAQNSLYRGEEHLHAITEFAKIKEEAASVLASTFDNFCWRQALSGKHESVLRFKNTVIGTLAEDITAGVSLDDAVKKFESKVAPANYKRPTALVTPRMIQDAEKTVNELGLTSALHRRFAVPEDMDVTNSLFVNRNVAREGRMVSGGSAFAALSATTAVNPKNYSKVELISLASFVKDVLPTAQSIEFLLENRHESQLVSLIAPEDLTAGQLFKWNNPFSWSYNKALADGIKERVKEAGGNIEAELRFSLQWNEDGKSIVDLDLHAIEPDRNEIFYMRNRGRRTDFGAVSMMSGNLDVDMVNPRGTGIENITWTDRRKMKFGTYEMRVKNFNEQRHDGCRCQIEAGGVIYELSCNKHFSGTISIATVTYDERGFTVVPAKGIDGTGSQVKSKKVWNLDTHTFVPVTAVTYSPNYWNPDWTGTGNRHVFFFLQGAKNESIVRGFFNEMLDSRLDKHKRVFETLAGKLTVTPAEEELSGVGFATTGDHEFIVKVKGSFERVLRVVA